MADVSNRRVTYAGEADRIPADKRSNGHAQEKVVQNGHDGPNSKLERQVSKATVASFGMGPKTASLYLSRTSSMVKAGKAAEKENRAYHEDSNKRDNSEDEEHRSVSRTSQHSKGSNAVPSKRTWAEPPLQKEFTFTGYDIMADREPEVPESTDRKEREKQENVQSYVSACRLLNITPISYLVKHINDQNLKMKSHPIAKPGTRALCIALVNNKRVQSLDVEDNDLGSEGAVCISELLQKNFTISDLNISENRIGTIGVQAIADVLKDNRPIFSLDISGSNLEDDDAKYVAQIMETNRNLKVFKVSHNSFGPSGGIILGQAIALNDTLHDLDLSWNHLRIRGAMAVAAGLQRNVGLKRLNISWNGFGKEGCTQMGVALSENRTLNELDISSNRMGKDAVGGLMKGVQLNETLTILRIGHNPFSPEVALTILRAIAESDKCGVTTLDMGEMVVDEDFVKFWEEIKKTKSLRVLFGATVKGTEAPRHDPNAIDWRDPVVRMFQYMQDMGYRVVDLLKRLDKDRSLSVDREEFKRGMMAFSEELQQAEHIPLTEAQLDEIVARLDTDGDGEVDMAELMAGEKEFRRKMHARTRRMMKQSMQADKMESVLKAMTKIDE